VECGAATTALFGSFNPEENNQKDNKMEPDEFAKLLVAALANPDVSAAIAKIAQGSDDDEPSVADAAMSDEKAAAEMEDAAGVTDADKKPEDDKKPALMRAFARCNRAHKRQLAANQDSIITQAEARFSGKIGTLSKRIESVEVKGQTGELPFVARMRKHLEVNPDTGTAIMRARRDSAEEYNQWEAAGRPMPK